MSGHEAGQILGYSNFGSKDRIQRALKPDAQGFDEVRIFTVPRYKTSGLSGDEWRISATIQVYRKGVLIHEKSCRNVETAATFLPALLLTLNDDGKAFYAGEGSTCDQEGCCDKAVITYRLKARYCRDGHKLEPFGIEVRKFCDRHKHRGDCGLEDADSNYEALT